MIFSIKINALIIDIDVFITIKTSFISYYKAE